ncbi:MAG TPA: hypothetical protein VI365_10030, partial [Trebonia sp.]
MAEATRTEGPRRSVTGPSGPAVRTPPRQPRSVRRTTTHDSLRPEGMSGPVTVIAQGRDLYTAADGSATVVASARIDAIVSSPENVLESMTVDPADNRLRALAGRRASAGFRRAVDELLPGEADLGTVRYQLLDDMPTALLVSGYAVLAGWHAAGGAPGGAGLQRRPALSPGAPSPGAPSPGAPGGRRQGRALQQVDLCSGWVSGGVMVSGIAEGIPPYFEGPAVPDVAGPDAGDSDGWHAHGRLSPGGMRRRRRIDAWLDTDTDGTPVARVESFFRDSYFPWDGGAGPDEPGPADAERVIHEYSV